MCMINNGAQMIHLEFFKKFKRCKDVELSPGFFGVFFFSVCFILCILFLDYRAVTSGVLHYHGLINWFGLDGSTASTGARNERADFLAEGGGGCDVFDGNWVWDESYPLYQSQDCSFLDGGFRCSENGRPDNFYSKWRWQPKDCNLPRFDPKIMLERLRNRRIVFVGDSIGRNQWESFLCMLSSGINNKSSVYEVNGNPITKHTGFLVFKFNEFNCTVEYYRSPFLVPISRPPVGAPKEVRTTLRLDKLDWMSSRWKDADVLVFNSGHWWNYGKTLKGGCYFQVGNEVKMEMNVESAYRRSIETLLDWIGHELYESKTQVFFRGYAPVHYRGGNWKTGGSCHEETLPDLGASAISADTWVEAKIVVDVLSERSNNSQVGQLDLLNVTTLTWRRKDGHASLYYLGPAGPAALNRQDCSHWCLPGVPDTWNELLYALFLKREYTRTLNLT